MKCSNPGCNDCNEIYLHPTCHPHAGTWTYFEHATDLIVIVCKECKKEVVAITVK